jgi:DNA helicase-2/ATP-dependent DNA helicase PcrA
MSIDLSTLNSEQQAAVKYGKGPLLVYAGAGSGKTRVLTTRIAYLVTQHGIDPSSILAITFTNKAAREMKERLIAMLGETASKMWISTFHSACLRMIRPHASFLKLPPSFSIYDEDDSRKLVHNCIEDAGLDPKEVNPGVIQAAISIAKNQLVTPAQLAKEARTAHQARVARVYEIYNAALIENAAVDFDDILTHTVTLFQEHPEILESYQRIFEWIFVDEYQDTNIAQNQIIKLLGEKHRNVCVVGDLDQSIYAFRGAETKNIMEFSKMFPGVHTITLEQNYRSTKTILDAANAVIENNEARPPKTLRTLKAPGAQIVARTFRSGTDEVYWLADEVVSLMNGGTKGENIAVLCRQKVIGRDAEKALLSRGVSCRFVGSTPFFDRTDVKSLISYLKMLLNPNDEIAFRRVVNTPSRRIGDKSVAQIRAWSRSVRVSLSQAIQRGPEIGLPARAAEGLVHFNKALDLGRKAISSGASADRVLETILVAVKYREWLSELGGDDAIYRLENVDELVEIAIGYPTVEALLETAGLVNETDEIPDEDHRVLIMTIHAAKGLEFPIVFIPALEENIFPDRRSLFDQNDLEEERRLAYVAITRAQTRLYLTNALSRIKYGAPMRNDPSRFLAEIPSHLLLSRGRY